MVLQTRPARLTSPLSNSVVYPAPKCSLMTRSKRFYEPHYITQSGPVQTEIFLKTVALRGGGTHRSGVALIKAGPRVYNLPSSDSER